MTGSCPADAVAEESVILASASYDHTIRFWQASTGLCLRTVQHTDSQVNAMAVTPDRKLLASAGYQHIRMYDILSSNPNPVLNYEGVSKNVTALGFQNENRWMYTGGEDNSAKIWDMRCRNIQCQRIFQVNTPVNCVCLHPNQSELFVGDQNGTLYLWDLRTDHNEQLLPEPGVSIQDCAVDSQGTMLAVVNARGHAFVWNLIGSGVVSQESSKLVPKCHFECHKKYPLKCLFSPDCTLLATTSADQTAKLWRTADFTTGEMSEMISLKHDTKRWVWDAAFTNDSQYLFTCASDNLVRLWRVETGQIVREYNGHQKAVTSLVFVDVEV